MLDPSRPVLSQLVELSDSTWNDPAFEALRAFRARSPEARVIGCFPVYTPEELIHAAGFLPAHIFGAGQLVEIEHADSRIQSFVCSICRSTLELGLTGKVHMLDGFLFPSICDVSRNLAAVWKRNFPDHFVAYCHWPEHCDSRHARQYLRLELARIRAGLEELRGRPITQGELNSSLATYNENRQLLQSLRSLRARTPDHLTLAELFRLTRAGGFMRREEHNQLVARALDEAQLTLRQPRDRVRVVLEGAFCEQIPVELIEMIEQAGCYVVDDDLLLGARWYGNQIPADTADPVGALADAFLAQAPSCAVHHGGVGRIEAFGRRLEHLGAQGVIFAAAKFCEPALYDYVLLKNEVERRGLPYLSFEFEEKMSVFDAIQTQVETFVESALFFSGASGVSR